MIIRFKIIEHERMADSPFIGAVVSAIDCWDNCPNCFNQNLKNLPTKEANADEIIAEIKANPLNEGVILSGLEWTLQAEEMISLLYAAKQSGLKTMLYTSMTGNEFFRWFNLTQASRNLSMYGRAMYWRINIKQHLDYIKFGAYDETKKIDGYSSCNVTLASKNQYIKEL